MKTNLIPLLFPLLLPALFCSADTAPSLAPIEPLGPQLVVPVASKLAFKTFLARARNLPMAPVSAVLHNAGEYQAVVGLPAPADIDFTRVWVAFYSAGRQHANALEASITGIELLPGGREVRVTTQLGLSATGMDHYYVLAKFRRPPSIPRKSSFIHTRAQLAVVL